MKRRSGRIAVSSDMTEDKEMMNKLFNRSFSIVRVEKTPNLTIFTAIHDKFDIIDDKENIPFYSIIFSKDQFGNVCIEKIDRCVE